MSKIDLLPDLNVENSKTNSTVENGVNEFIEYLQNLRIETSGNLLIGHLIINSIRNKVGMLSYMIGTSESKLDDTFSTSQFVIDSFTEPFRLDRTRNGCGILLYVKNNITATLLTSYTLPTDIEALFVEIVIGNFIGSSVVHITHIKYDNLSFTGNRKRFGILKLQIMRKYC